MKAKEIKIFNEMKRRDSLLGFACGNVFEPPSNNVQTSQELRTNFLKFRDVCSLYVRTNFLTFQDACTYTYKLTQISVSLYVRTNLLDVQTYSNIYVGKFSSPPLKGFNLGPFTNSANNKTKLREAIVWQALINCAIVGTKTWKH